MCGISGLYLKKGQPVDPQQLMIFNEALAHRGPDASGLYYKNNIGLSHTRLKILDLSDTANQPFKSSDQKKILVYNGEIYNFQEIRNDLIKEGITFKSTGDTEVLFQGLIQYGEKLIPRLNGIFAFAFLDLSNNSPVLMLARDRFGVKPLFLSIKNNQLAFSSTMAPLLKLDWIKKNINPEVLFYFLKFGHVPTPLSILSDITQLKPGYVLHFNGNNLEEHCYFDLFKSQKNYLPLSEDEATNQLETLLGQSVKRQSISDVPVGIFLSGGIDSSLLTTSYLENVGKSISTFSIKYKESEFDESSYAQIVAQHLHTDHHEILVEPKDLFNQIPSIPKFFDQPFSDPTMLPTMFLCEQAKKKITVALSGDGGDELFFGYTYQQMMLHLNALRHLPSPLRSTVLKLLKNSIQCIPGKLPITLQQICKFCDILSFENSEEFCMYFIGTIGPMHMNRLKQIVNLPGLNHTKHYHELLQNFNHENLFHQIERLFQSTFLPDTVLQKTDRASMAFGLEARVPFLDNDLFDFSRNLNPGLKYKNGIKKYLLRKLLAKKLPPIIANRKKQGFSIPMRQWIKTDLKYLLDIYLDQTLKSDPYLNPVEIKKLVYEHLQNRANHNHLLWSLIVYQMWKEHYSIN